MSKDTQETRPTARPETATVSAKTQNALQLIEQLLTEAAKFGPNSTRTGGAEQSAYSKLHQAFRKLFTLRGEDFERGFAIFQEQIRKNPNGIFSNSMVNRNLEYFTDSAERETFMVFINMLSRFARLPAAQKGNFKNSNNIQRLLVRIADPDLQHQLADLFLAN